MSHIQHLDELIRDYLIFRGFTSSLRNFDNDLKNDKDKGFRVDRIVNQILNCIQVYDLQALRDLWAHLDQRLFQHLPPSLLSSSKKLEINILKFYVVNTICTNKSEKLLEFFDKMASEIHNVSEWKEWFALPHLKNVEDNSIFAPYFSRQWQDTLLVSLHNFLAIVYQNLKLPRLAEYLEESKLITKLQEENDLLRARLNALVLPDGRADTMKENVVVPVLKDDFSQLSPEPQNNEAQTKSLKSFLGLGVLSSSNVSSTGHPNEKLQKRSHPRRSSSSDDKMKSRSSSLAANVRTSEHRVMKRLSQNPSDHMSRSPVKSVQSGESEVYAPFLLISREYYPDHHTIVSHTLFNHSGDMVASADVDGVVKLWSPHPAVKTYDTVYMNGSVAGLDWLRKAERLLLIGTKSGDVRLYDSQDRKALWDFSLDANSESKSNRILCVKSSPSDQNFVVGVEPRSKLNRDVTCTDAAGLLIFDMKSQNLDHSIQLGRSAANSCVLNHNGGLVICGCSDGFIRIVDVRTGEIVMSWLAHVGEVFAVKLSPLEDKIYSIGSDNKLMSWSLAQTGEQLMEFPLHEKASGPFLVSNDSQVSSSNGSRTVSLRPYAPLFALSHDGQQLFTCSPSGAVLYKMQNDSLKFAMSIKGHSSPVLSVDFSTSPACGSCVAASIDGKVSLSTLIPR